MASILSFGLAFISIVYELALAQTVSLFFGNTFLIYSSTIGIYTFALGFGALFYEKKTLYGLKSLGVVEALLSFSAIIAPFLIVFSATSFSTDLLGKSVYLIAFLPIIVVGFLSGIELPYLLHHTSQKTSVLFWDYVGMCLGSIFVGALAIEWLGAIRLLWTMSFLNALLLAVIIINSKKVLSYKFLLTINSVLILLSLSLIWKEQAVYNFFRTLHGF